MRQLLGRGFLGKRPSTPVLGLDISSTAVKLLELSRSGDRCRVEGYAACPLPADAVVERNFNDIDGIASTIHTVVRQSGTKLKTAAAAVAGSAVIVRQIDMPADLGEDDMETQLTLEAGQHIPYPLEELAMDFETQGAAPESGGKAEVLLVACRRETVDARVEAMAAADLQPKIMDVEAYAMARACGLVRKQADIGAEDAVALVDIGAAMTTLSVLVGDRVIYTREQLFGGRQLIDGIMRRYNLSMEEAVQARKQGGLPDDYGPEVLEPFRGAVVQQVARALQFFFSSSQYNDVDCIVMAGGVSCMEGLAEQVQDKLGTSVTVANPFADMAVASRVDAVALSDDAPALMTACGLALRSFD